MKKPVLVIMAAGMGSRYGGLKQLDPVGENGQMIIDYSIYDARRAGFETVVFVIKPEIEADFKALVGDRVATCMDVKYVHQLKEDLPAGYSVPAERAKEFWHEKKEKNSNRADRAAYSVSAHGFPVHCPFPDGDIHLLYG